MRAEWKERQLEARREKAVIICDERMSRGTKGIQQLHEDAKLDTNTEIVQGYKYCIKVYFFV